MDTYEDLMKKQCPFQLIVVTTYEATQGVEKAKKDGLTNVNCIGFGCAMFRAKVIPGDESFYAYCGMAGKPTL
jgi:hypothetical protein